MAVRRVQVSPGIVRWQQTTRTPSSDGSRQQEHHIFFSVYGMFRKWPGRETEREKVTGYKVTAGFFFFPEPVCHTPPSTPPLFFFKDKVPNLLVTCNLVTLSTYISKNR